MQFAVTDQLCSSAQLCSHRTGPLLLRKSQFGRPGLLVMWHIRRPAAILNFAGLLPFAVHAGLLRFLLLDCSFQEPFDDDAGGRYADEVLSGLVKGKILLLQFGGATLGLGTLANLTDSERQGDAGQQKRF